MLRFFATEPARVSAILRSGMPSAQVLRLGQGRLRAEPVELGREHHVTRSAARHKALLMAIARVEPGSYFNVLVTMSTSTFGFTKLHRRLLELRDERERPRQQSRRMMREAVKIQRETWRMIEQAKRLVRAWKPCGLR